MASIFAHAAVPLVFRGLFPANRRLTIAAVVLACWPDADYVTLAFEVRPNELLGHRGLTHSILVAGVLAVTCAAIWFRAGIGSRVWWRTVAFLFAVAASHGLLDTMTAGDIGVALFAPLTNARFSFPFKLIASCPGGMNEYVGFWGLLTIANEMLYVVIPLALIASALGSRGEWKRWAAMACAWTLTMIALRISMPDWFKPTVARILMPINTPDAGQLKDIPRDGLPGEKLVTRLVELRALGLFDTVLKPTNATWSSSFFPTWFGGEGGRWMDGAPTLTWRTLFGFSAPTEVHARAWLSAAAGGDARAERRLFSLAPTEKLDLAFNQLSFPATEQSIGRTHNAKPKPRYWSGRCNGIATASLTLPEPFRVVDVIGLDGSHIRFHPNDIKSFLALGYDDPKTMTVIGNVCTLLAFDAPATCSMNPAVLLIATLNRIGLAKRTFLVDALPTIAKQYYAVAAVRAHVSEPRSMDKTAADVSLAGKIMSLVDAEIELTLSSTTLPYSRANVIDSASRDGSRYRRVGLVPVIMKYTATLALDDNGELIGGRWTGDPPDGPDDVLIVDGEPALLDNGRLAGADQIPWSFVRELAQKSVEEGAAMPTIDLRTQ